MSKQDHRGIQRSRVWTEAHDVVASGNARIISLQNRHIMGCQTVATLKTAAKGLVGLIVRGIPLKIPPQQIKRIIVRWCKSVRRCSGLDSNLGTVLPYRFKVNTNHYYAKSSCLGMEPATLSIAISRTSRRLGSPRLEHLQICLEIFDLPLYFSMGLGVCSLSLANSG